MEVERVMSDASETDQLVADYMPDSQPAVDSEGHTFTSIQALYSGTFRDVDKQHKGSGTATVYQDANGVLVLRLDDFKVTNGPVLHVLLTPHDDPKSRADVFQEGYLDLGNLKGNIGSQNYAIPENTDVQSLKSVVIYCQPFHVVFSVATIKPER
ncbi:MAG: DM13 domain-containing protein [Chloroflexi bacterium]|nr:DM13 domain-containing protein [Chloroflexota bacterium]MDA1229073.1 DM13 domain-containing protein [Chloroflexota bacterium]